MDIVPYGNHQIHSGRALDDEQLSEVLDAMFEKKAEVGDTIIKQVNSRGYFDNKNMGHKPQI